MTIRPQFSKIKSYKEFSKYYWYRDELKLICNKLGIDSSGMKTDLNHNIEEYFKGNIIHAKTKRKADPKKTDNLSLETSLIECGFSFGPKFRAFFAKTAGVQNFKFNADMVASARKVKEDNDLSFTLGDMLDIYYGKKVYAKYNKESLLWNKFVKDFCNDNQTSEFRNKLKVASILWNQVRNSTNEKVYNSQLLKDFADLIKEYRIGKP